VRPIGVKFGTIIPEWIVERLDLAADPRREGAAVSPNIPHELAAIPGMAGADTMAPQSPSAIVEVIAAFGAAVQPWPPIVTMTGTWSEALSQARHSRRTRASARAPTSPGVTQM
jgi:hypothetical protein